MNRKLNIWLPLVLSLVMIVGMYVGYKFKQNQPASGFFKTTERNVIDDALSIIKTRYVDSVRLDTLQSNAVREMMNELDPHSVYLSAQELEASTEDLSGNFQGIGVEFNIVRDTVNVTYVIANGPSSKAGIEIGDQIIKVNDSSLVVKDLQVEQVRGLIRGVDGSKAKLTILRNKQIKNIEVIRGVIQTPSVLASYMVDAKTGYIKLDKFAGSTYREFMIALDSLKKKGMSELIFDLRGNGGGYLDQAVEIADEFLDGDKLIVYTEGSNSAKKEYRGKRPGLFEKGNLVVLVDELSASASEIIAGALQDWDRATIIGRRTFGKGLVQEIFPLSDGSAVKLTVSRYYTPLGRSIQKPYKGGKKVYMDEVWERYANGEAFYADSNKVSNGKQYKTPKGKTVYGGGGIMPDEFVGLDTTKASREVNRLFYSGTLNDFVFHYYLDHKNILDAYNTPMAYEKSFDPSKDMWQRLVLWSQKESINLAAIDAKERKRIEDRMEAYLARFKWRDNGFYQIINVKDSTVLKALNTIK